MSIERTYTKPHRLAVLHDQLIAAGITPEAVNDRGDVILLLLPDGTNLATVDAVAQAHDPNALTQREQDTKTRRDAVVAQLQPLVGLAWGALTAAQRQTLILAVLYRLDVIDKDLRIRPLGEWL